MNCRITDDQQDIPIREVDEDWEYDTWRQKQIDEELERRERNEQTSN